MENDAKKYAVIPSMSVSCDTNQLCHLFSFSSYFIMTTTFTYTQEYIFFGVKIQKDKFILSTSPGRLSLSSPLVLLMCFIILYFHPPFSSSLYRNKPESQAHDTCLLSIYRKMLFSIHVDFHILSIFFAGEKRKKNYFFIRYVSCISRIYLNFFTFFFLSFWHNF